jgi:23S rRNA (guanosine2251-2'-O)-methyltransferase
MRKLANTEMGRLSIDEFKSAPKFPFVLVLDNIRSMSNIGSIFRTADAFRIEELLLCGITACPPHREIQRTALDASESVKWKYYEHTESAVRHLHKHDYAVYAAEQVEGSILLQDFKPVTGKKIAVIMGNELHGIDDNILSIVDGCIEIPQYGTKHSFNVAVSAGIILWDLFRHTALKKS